MQTAIDNLEPDEDFGWTTYAPCSCGGGDDMYIGETPMRAIYDAMLDSIIRLP